MVWLKKGHKSWKKGRPGWGGSKPAAYRTVVEDILNSDEEFLDIVPQGCPDPFDGPEPLGFERESSTEDSKPEYVAGHCRLCGGLLPHQINLVMNTNAGLTCYECLAKLSKRIFGK